MTNIAQVKAIEQKNKLRWLAVNPQLSDTSGIYVMTRTDGILKYAYVGQAKNILTRLAQHLVGDKQHIDLSLKKHGLFSEENPGGWKVVGYRFPTAHLDDAERYYIKQYASAGFQLRNKTAGGQDEGKQGIAPNKPSKGYHEGVAYGYKKATREIKHLFDLHLNAVTKSDKPNKNQEKALLKFKTLLEGEDENGNEQ